MCCEHDMVGPGRLSLLKVVLVHDVSLDRTEFLMSLSPQVGTICKKGPSGADDEWQIYQK